MADVRALLACFSAQATDRGIDHVFRWQRTGHGRSCGEPGWRLGDHLYGCPPATRRFSLLSCARTAKQALQRLLGARRSVRW